FKRTLQPSPDAGPVLPVGRDDQTGSLPRKASAGAGLGQHHTARRRRRGPFTLPSIGRPGEVDRPTDEGSRPTPIQRSSMTSDFLTLLPRSPARSERWRCVAIWLSSLSWAPPASPIGDRPVPHSSHDHALVCRRDFNRVNDPVVAYA